MKNLLIIGLISLSANLFSQCVNCDSVVNTGINSSAIGTNTVSTGHSAFASGFRSEASGFYSTAMGYHSLSSGMYSIALGNYVSSNGAMSTAIGNMVTATYEGSIIIGSGGEWFSGHYLENNHPRTLMVGFSSVYPTFFVSDSPLSPYSNKTGRIGIGNIPLPQVKLHLRSDNDESAALFLEPSNWTSDYNAEIFLGNQQHGISAELNKGLVFKTEHYYLFNQGYLGIGTDDPAAKVHIKSGDIYIEDIDRGIIMKSPDGICWRGTLNDQGQLIFQALSECPEDAAISIKESTPNKLDISIHPNPTENNIEIEIPDLGSKSLVFMLVDENGKVVKSLKITGIKTTVNTADLAPGLYFGNFSGDNINFVEKIVKL